MAAIKAKASLFAPPNSNETINLLQSIDSQQKLIISFSQFDTISIWIAPQKIASHVLCNIVYEYDIQEE